MKIVYALAIVLIIAVLAIWLKQDEAATNSWVYDVTFRGEITDLYYNPNDRMFFIYVDTAWYGLIYFPRVDLDSLKGCGIEKRINEEGVWIKNKEKVFLYKTRGFVVTDHPSPSLENIHRYIESKNEIAK